MIKLKKKAQESGESLKVRVKLKENTPKPLKVRVKLKENTQESGEPLKVRVRVKEITYRAPEGLSRTHADQRRGQEGKPLEGV